MVPADCLPMSLLEDAGRKKTPSNMTAFYSLLPAQLRTIFLYSLVRVSISITSS